jgi:hypothetical protein
MNNIEIHKQALEETRLLCEKWGINFNNVKLMIANNLLDESLKNKKLIEKEIVESLICLY